jgi:hypothetical protein
MVQRVSTVAFEGIEARAVDVQVQVAPGLPAFTKVRTINPQGKWDSKSYVWEILTNNYYSGQLLPGERARSTNEQLADSASVSRVASGKGAARTMVASKLGKRSFKVAAI